MTLYDNIKTLRENLKMSQDELARKVGYKDRTSIAKIESGKIDLAQSKIFAFAEALNTTPEDLMGLHYYNDQKVSEYAQAVKDNPNLKLLFDASKDMSKDDIDFVINTIEMLKKREGK
ncbi:helix-turn-helix domain-containing protein [uncultured Veillonella sp.]|jgi:toxin-antitoxin system, antitoxin component, xre family|uniref:helix-turn-helix domain-containing protein n=1 Tax=uncultured Veillonella sp. TaxID=159268 RepID=UPI001CB59DC9|nr:helix-turn-helix transcriptional regulator [uncultured Veillonella sp.]MBF1762673.1 helix-turn-helix transcriptional regulator [Veillonella sp.]DAK20494.1 MAG TPA: helix-turn-helix domain protein [Caudoviricetes sp.]DAT45060.1 MAG TPA: helix-turn-helix domain protein [Caudoviricetes sp.]DAX80287.1 MAG TPA: helix-turn-helix domain protein [Caudoviricetes sp.]